MSEGKLGRALWVLFAVNVLNFYDRHVIGALAEPIRREFNLTDTDLGLLGSAFIWLYAFIGVPIGRVADTWSRRKLLALGTLVWSLLTALNGAATSFTTLLLARLGVATGEAACAPTATSWIGDLYQREQRSRALAVFMLGVPIGAGLCGFLSGFFAQQFGWRTAMVIAAVPGLLLVPLLLSLPEPVRGATEKHGQTEAAGSAWSVLRIPTLWWIIASGALLNFNMYAFGSFLPALFARVHGVTLAQSGVLAGIVSLVGGVSGGLLASRLGDAAIRKRQNGRMRMGAWLALATAPLALFGIQSGDVMLSVVLLSLAYGGCNSYYGFVYPSIQDIVPPALRSTTMAVYFMAMYLCGASFGPLLTGRLSDLRARAAAEAAGSATITEAFRATGLREAMLIIPVLALGLAIVLWAGSRTIAADIARREQRLAKAATGVA